MQAFYAILCGLFLLAVGVWVYMQPDEVEDR